MKIEVLLFGVLAEELKETSLVLTNIKDIDSLKAQIFERYPSVRNFNFQVSVNQTVTHENIKLKNGDEVALLPPFAGG